MLDDIFAMIFLHIYYHYYRFILEEARATFFIERAISCQASFLGWSQSSHTPQRFQLVMPDCAY